jgi:putative ABC transport system permease protein
MFMNPGVDLTSAMQALVILVIAGTLAGIIPARRAVSISPVDALRAD